MACLNSFRKVNELTGQEDIFPCGQCYDCKMRRVSEWYFRIKQEVNVSKSGMFLTLTYADDFLPYCDSGFPTVYKPDLQNFWKRLRKRYKHKLVYYACGEYGGKFGRPHYHAVLFNANPEQVEEEWRVEDQPIGNCHFDPVNDGSIKYVAGYMNKYKSRKDYPEKFGEFACMSKGIGKNYFVDEYIGEWTGKKRYWPKENIVRYHRSDYSNVFVNDGPEKISMPRYFKDHIYDDYTREEVGIVAQLKSRDVADKEMDVLLKQHGSRENVQRFLKQLNFDKFRKLSRNASKRGDF